MSDQISTENVQTPEQGASVQQNVQQSVQETAQQSVQETVQQNEQQSEPQNGQPSQEQTQDAKQGGVLDELLDSQKQEAQQNEAVPEKYEFKVQEGAEPLSDDDAAAYSAVAREMGLTQEQAQKLFDSASPKIAEIYQRKAQQTLSLAQANWNKALQNDAELGGQNLQTTKLNIQRFLRSFGTEGFSSVMRSTGMINHPEIARVMARVGAAMGNDNQFINGSTKPAPKRDPLTDLYNNSPELV